MPIIENILTGRLYRLIEYRQFAEGPQVYLEELRTGEKTVAAPQNIAPYTGGKVVDFHV